jgi:hypothetical protein
MSLDVNRLAVITWIAENTSGLGRTALMKYCYFLQIVCGVPLGYRFSLYSYGPFDSDVLSDLDIVESMAGVKSTVEYFSGGYGYRIECGENAAGVKRLGEGFLQTYEQQLQWVVDQFSGWSASDLEVATTLVYSDREAARRRERLTLSELAHGVRELKPRYGISQIESYAEKLVQRRLLTSLE